jgi:hypothetical protein
MPSEELPLIGTRGSMTLRLHVDRRVLLGGDGRFIFEARPVRDLRQSKPVKISVSG